MLRTERGVEGALAAGWQDDEHAAARVARIDLQLWDLDVRLKRSTALAQPAGSQYLASCIVPLGKAISVLKHHAAKAYGGVEA